MAEPETVVADLFEAMGTQRAMRRLKPDPVPKGHVKKILWAATRAPNGGNVQPWRFLVVVDAEKKKRLQEMYAEQWAKYIEVDQRRPRADQSADAIRSHGRHGAFSTSWSKTPTRTA